MLKKDFSIQFVLHNYFGPTKLLDLYLAKFLDISTKPFFLCSFGSNALSEESESTENEECKEEETDSNSSLLRVKLSVSSLKCQIRQFARNKIG